MKTRTRALGGVLAAALFGLSGCSGLSEQTRDTAVGAAVGGVAGSVLTGGGTAGTIGGAAVGGIIGNQVGKPK